MTDFEMAPAAIVRVCAWPVDVLDSFGSLDSSGPGDSKSYDDIIARERVSLWNQTVCDPTFLKALLLASPSLYTRVSSYQSMPAKRPKKVRHLETALYRYLIRAATRTTPNQMWAGVAFSQFGERDEIRSTEGGIYCSPDLVPFERCLRILGERLHYRRGAQWRLTPTLRRQNDGSWHFLVRHLSGRPEAKRLEATALIETYLYRLASCSCGTLIDLAGRTNTPIELLENMTNAGLLTGGLALPLRFSSPWEALEIAGEQLSETDRVSWREAKDSFAEISATIESIFENATPHDILQLIVRARGQLQKLFAALQVDVSVPEMPLRCDLQLPFAVILGDKTRARIQATLQAYQSEWLDRVSPASRTRKIQRRWLAENLKESPLPFGQRPPMMPANEYELAVASTELTRNDADEVTLSEGAAPTDDHDCSAPWGTLIAQLADSQVVRVVGVDDSVGRLFSRHFRPGSDDTLVRWIKNLFSQAEVEYGAKVADLAISFEDNPNVLSCPELTATRVAPWNATGVDLTGAEIRSQGNRIVLHTSGDGDLIVTSCTPSNVMGRDWLANLLALTGFNEQMPSNMPAALRILPGERQLRTFTPRVRLSDGAIIRPRRTVLTREDLKEFPHLCGKERYFRWCVLAGQLRWPDTLSLRIDDQPPLVVKSSSPLSIEAALQGIERAQHMIVEETNFTGVTQTACRMRICELFIPFARRPNSLSVNTASTGIVDQ